MKLSPLYPLALLCLSGSTPLFADSVYKSVDENGNVSYSSTPKKNADSAEKITILPPPSPEAAQAAQQRYEKSLQTNKILDENRQRRLAEQAERNRIKREKREQIEAQKKPEEPKQEGPYYGIPGHGIIVLPGGPRISQ